MPLEEEWAEIALSYEQTYFFEEGIRAGGIGESLGLILLQRGYTGKYRNVAIDGFVPSCRTQSGLEKAGLDAKSIQELVRADCMDKEKVRPWARTI